MAKWVEYTGSKEQLEKLASAKTMVRIRYANGREVNWAYTLFKSESGARAILETAIAYLISEPHPYADLIDVWRLTGCEVYIREHHNNYYDGVLESTDYHDLPPTDKPDWNIPGAEYRLTLFED